MSPRSRIRSRRFFALARLLRSRQGLTTLEFAFISPVILLMMMGIIEFSLIMFTMASMESATAASARTGKTGYLAPGMTREQTLINSIESRTAGLLDPTKIVITTTIYPNFDNVEDAEPYTDTNSNGSHDSGEPYTDINGNGEWDEDMGLAGLGQPGDIVVYRISYPWTVYTPIVGLITGNPFNIVVRTVVKNEPFNI